MKFSILRILNPVQLHVKRSATAAASNGVKHKKGESFDNYYCFPGFFQWQSLELLRCNIHQYCQTKPERIQDFIACRKKGQFSSLVIIEKTRTYPSPYSIGYECEEGFELTPGNVPGRGFYNKNQVNSKMWEQEHQNVFITSVINDSSSTTWKNNHMVSL